MKQLLFFAAIIFVIACNQNDNKSMTDQDKDAIKSEAQKMTESFLGLASKVDMKVFDLFGDTANYVGIADGYKLSFSDIKNGNVAAFGVMKSQAFNKKFEEHRVMDKETVLWTWNGDGMITFKNDSTFNLKDYSLTALLKNINGNWKLVYSHESFPSSSDFGPMLMKAMEQK